jgi:hypothetical protein
MFLSHNQDIAERFAECHLNGANNKELVEICMAAEKENLEIRVSVLVTDEVLSYNTLCTMTRVKNLCA